jgi:hypothetical protein
MKSPFLLSTYSNDAANKSDVPKELNFNSNNIALFQTASPWFSENHLLDTLSLNSKIGNLNTNSGLSNVNSFPFLLSNHSTDTLELEIKKTLNSFNSDNLSPLQISSPLLLSSYSTDTLRFQIPQPNVLNIDNTSPFQTVSPLLLPSYSTDTVKFQLPKSNFLNSDNTLPLGQPFDFSNLPNANENILDEIDYSDFLPSFYMGTTISLQYSNDSALQRLDSFYLVLTPSTYHGSSGSPVFYLCRSEEKDKIKEWIEFAGIQSGIGLKDNVGVSFIVKSEQLIKELQKKIKSKSNP